MTSDSKDVLIIGCGFAGLVAAITLKQAGIPFKLFEANSEAIDTGGSITMFPNSMRVLRSIGVAEQVVEGGVVMEVAKFQDNNGKHMVNRSMGKKDIYGEPTITLRRSKLNNILHQKAQDLGIPISFNKKLVELIENEDEVSVRFEDGTSETGSIVLGCDGINSAVRNFVLSEKVLPNYVGLVYFGGFVDDQALIKRLGFDPHTQYISVGPTHFFAYSFVDNPATTDASLLWYCYLRQDNRMSKKELAHLPDNDVIKRVSSVHQGWHDPVEDLIKNTGEICKASISDIVEIDTWHKGRSVVLGDAAHAMNPLSGQGAGTAIEDGYLLGKLLHKYDGDHQLAFENFEKLRKSRTSAIGKRARKSSKQTTKKYNSIITSLRNKAYAIVTFLTPEKLLNKHLSYDVDKELEQLK